MCSAPASFVKITLRGAEAVCGTCRHINRHEFMISSWDHKVLKEAAQAILQAPAGVTIQLETVLHVANFFGRISNYSLRCGAQRCRTWLGDSCALWVARDPEGSPST